MKNVSCPNVVGNDLKGLEIIAGVAAGASLLYAAAWVFKFLGNSALAEVCEGVGCGEPSNPEEDHDIESSKTTSSSSICSLVTLHNITSYCESYFNTKSFFNVPSIVTGTTCPSSTTESTTFCESASLVTRKSTIATTSWRDCKNTTVGDLTKYCLTSSARPTFTTCPDSTTGNRTGCFITATTASSIANETCAVGANLLGYADPQGEFGQIIPMLNQSCPYLPGINVSMNEDQGQCSNLSDLCSKPSSPYLSPLPSINDHQGDNDDGLCPTDPIGDQSPECALDGNLTESCYWPINSTDQINPFDADQGQDGSELCEAPLANATGLH